MSGRYNLVKEFIVKPVAKVVKDAFKSRGKNPTPGTINTVPIAKNLTTKKAIEQKVVKTVDKVFKDANVPPSLRNQQKKSQLKKDEGKKLKSIYRCKTTWRKRKYNNYHWY